MAKVNGVFTPVYRFLKYGRQIGKTSPNGRTAYKFGDKITGLDEEGNVIKTIRTRKVAPFTSKSEIVAPDKFGDKVVHNVIKDDRMGYISVSSYDEDRYGYRSNFKSFSVHWNPKAKKGENREVAVYR